MQMMTYEENVRRVAESISISMIEVWVKEMNKGKKSNEEWKEDSMFICKEMVMHRLDPDDEMLDVQKQILEHDFSKTYEENLDDFARLVLADIEKIREWMRGLGDDRKPKKIFQVLLEGKENI